MTSTFTLLEDHLGNNSPKVMGTEYYVDASVNCTEYRTALTLTGDFVHTDNTFTLTVADVADFSRLMVGMELAITNAATGGNNATVTVTELQGEGLVGSVITFSAVTASDSADAITLTPSHEVLLASDFGLTKVTAIYVTGQEDPLNRYTFKTNDSGAYSATKKDGVEMTIRVGSTGTELSAAATTGDCVRLRVFGQI